MQCCGKEVAQSPNATQYSVSWSVMTSEVAWWATQLPINGNIIKQKASVFVLITRTFFLNMSKYWGQPINDSGELVFHHWWSGERPINLGTIHDRLFVCGYGLYHAFGWYWNCNWSGAIRVFFHRNSVSIDLSFCSGLNSIKVIATNFCSSQDIIAACGVLCDTAINPNKRLWNVNCDWQIVVKRTPERVILTALSWKWDWKIPHISAFLSCKNQSVHKDHITNIVIAPTYNASE